jgi:hypothetical protein
MPDALGSGAGIHFDCVKEELISVEDAGYHSTEEWRTRISEAFLTDGAGRRRSDLHPETQQLFASWELQREEEVLADSIRLSFVPGENQMQFAHGALVHLLAWERPAGLQQNWRHLLRAPTITRSIGDFGQALDRALGSQANPLAAGEGYNGRRSHGRSPAASSRARSSP